MSSAGGKRERRLRSNGSLVLDLDDVLVGLLALVVLVASQGVTTQTELAQLPCQPGREVLAYFLGDSEQGLENYCGKRVGLLAGVFVKAWDDFLHEFLISFLGDNFSALKSET